MFRCFVGLGFERLASQLSSSLPRWRHWSVSIVALHSLDGPIVAGLGSLAKLVFRPLLLHLLVFPCQLASLSLRQQPNQFQIVVVVVVAGSGFGGATTMMIRDARDDCDDLDWQTWNRKLVQLMLLLNRMSLDVLLLTMIECDGANGS